MKRIKNRALTIPEIYSGYNAAFQQARDLVSEANLLIEHDRFPGAFHRLVIALEEIGKARLLFYQGALTVGGRAPSWTDFWSEYYKHECKLDAALTWFDLRQLIGMGNAELIDRSLAAIREHARSLDEHKQKTSYSEPTENGFSTPVAEDFRPRTSCVLRMAKSLLELADSSELAEVTDADEFGEQLRLKYRFAVAVGYSDSASRRDLIEKIRSSSEAGAGFLDFWAVDWEYGSLVGADDKPIFETDWQSFRVRQSNQETDPIAFSAEYQFAEAGQYRIAARVTDVFGNDGLATVAVTVK